MMRIKHAKTVDKSGIVNMTAQSNATSLQTSSVESAVMPGIWLEIVLTDSVVLIGEMVHQLLVPDLAALLLVQVLAELVLAMLLTANMR
jgi:hypothetical protein